MFLIRHKAASCVGCALRNRFKRDKQFPARKFQCIYSDELLKNQAPNAEANGSLVHITGIFGYMLAGLVIQDIISGSK